VFADAEQQSSVLSVVGNHQWNVIHLFIPQCYIKKWTKISQ